VRQDYQKAAALFLEAAEQGDADAQYHLGEMYENGQGVKENAMKVYQYWKMAAMQGHQTAQKKLDIFCKQHPIACK